MNRRQIEHKLIQSLDLNIPVPFPKRKKNKILILSLTAIPVCCLLLVAFMGQKIPFNQTLISTLSVRSQEGTNVTKDVADKFYRFPSIDGYQSEYQLEQSQLSISLFQDQVKVSILIRDEMNPFPVSDQFYKIGRTKVYFYQDQQTVMAKFHFKQKQFMVSGNCSKKELIQIIKKII